MSVLDNILFKTLGSLIFGGYDTFISNEIYNKNLDAVEDAAEKTQ